MLNRAFFRDSTWRLQWGSRYVLQEAVDIYLLWGVIWLYYES
jgi:hypothetical protein